MSSIESISYLKETLLPKVNSFLDDIKKFHKTNDDVKQCIIRLDKSLSTKANKVELNILKEKLDTAFLNMSEFNRDL